jgi:hypothetical protein
MSPLKDPPFSDGIGLSHPGECYPPGSLLVSVLRTTQSSLPSKGTRLRYKKLSGKTTLCIMHRYVHACVGKDYTCQTTKSEQTYEAKCEQHRRCQSY